MGSSCEIGNPQFHLAARKQYAGRNIYRFQALQWYYFALQLKFATPCSLYGFDNSVWTTLVHWMAEVKKLFHLSDETLQLGAKIMDRFLDTKQRCETFYRKYFQLVGATSLLIAAKFEVCKTLYTILHGQRTTMEAQNMGAKFGCPCPPLLCTTP